MQSSTQINATKARMDKEVLALRAKSIFFKTLKYLSLIVASIVPVNEITIMNAVLKKPLIIPPCMNAVLKLSKLKKLCGNANLFEE